MADLHKALTDWRDINSKASVLRSIANSVEPLFPDAAELLRGIARDLLDLLAEHPPTAPVVDEDCVQWQADREHEWRGRLKASAALLATVEAERDALREQLDRGRIRRRAGVRRRDLIGGEES